MSPGPRVEAVAADGAHRFSKPTRAVIRLIAGIGVEGDAHAGATVKHRSRVARDPGVPNLRQVHLLQGELLDELVAADFPVGPGVIGENVTTRGIDLLALPTGTRLLLGPTAIVAITGLRNPCRQLDGLRPGLMAATLGRDAAGDLVRRAGVMAIVLRGGVVRAGDTIVSDLPPPPHRALAPV